MKLKIYNSESRRKEEFNEIENGEVKLYTCGPTVYNYAHIGNLRTYIFEDVLKKVLKYQGYKVKHVMNITDVGHLQSDGDEGEDKMELGAKRENKNVLELARFYEEAFFKDLERLNIEPPTVKARATEHIEDMINLIKLLESKGYTYVANRNVYFSIDKFPNYDKLANLNVTELMAGSRIEVDKFKKNPLDFVLWFVNSKYKNHILQWDSPWGIGFPGWHMECSAIAIKYLGENIDIHCGGIDHLPVHHTNEVAQSEAALGHKWVNYWVHGNYLILENEKMSKSSGTFYTLDKLIEDGFSPMDYRFYVLQSQYRKTLTFNYESLHEAKKSFESMKNRIFTVINNINKDESINEAAIEAFKDKFNESIYDDLNLANAFTVLHEVIKSKDLNNIEKKLLIGDFDRVFSLDLLNVAKPITLDKDKAEKVEDLIKERSLARANKQWKKADEIRDLLLEQNIEIKDTKEGTTWRLM
ncbi:cysteine--tRNA ligase [Inconstantimicrobium mannanitabidum]|uniref:Cysteine--tRNA ligase n=1 Tax=Inconstantimicrobium mannanitabidum TaxID=1604901 RepID=A0ACB5RBW1_9CLOT|nr:cysteine--tRNA ligase [Clostridium sp. TW13]GKX66625.1 cysteine--tRNA ligase [Clostridium sp. TW13]